MHEALVINGRFANSPDGVEAVLHAWQEAGLFREWSPGGGKGTPVARWERISPDTAAEGGPAARGGHQMVLLGNTIYLFGGWDGEKDLGEMWSWELPGRRETGFGGPWRKVHDGFEGKKGAVGERPRGRSCHQLAADSASGFIYLLGGMAGADDDDDSGSDDDSFEVPIMHPPETEHAEPGSPTTNSAAADASGAMDVDCVSSQASNLFDRLLGGAGPAPGRSRKRSSSKSDFWRFKAIGPRKGEWECLSDDTAAEGGPPRLWDHSMVAGRRGEWGNESLFVFGGKVERSGDEGENASSSGGPYGGLYEYSLTTKKWRTHL